MNPTDSPIIISERILPIDKDGDIYRIRRGDLPEFGDDEVDHREWYEGFLRGYRHQRVKVLGESGEPQYALSLVAPEKPERAYVEIDNWAEPILVGSEDGLKAVRLVEELIRGGIEKAATDLKKNVKQIVEFAQYEDRSLKTAVFERLWDYLNAPRDVPQIGKGEVPDELFALLPWETFSEYLERINDLLPLEKEPLEDYFQRLTGKGQNELPLYGHYFAYVHPGLAPALSHLVDVIEDWATDPYREPDQSKVIKCIWEFTSQLWGTRLGRLPQPLQGPGLQSLLSKSLARLVRLLEMLIENRDLPLSQGITGTLSIRNALVLCMRLRELGNKLDPQSRLYNLARAGRAAERAGFFDKRPWYLGPLRDEFRQAWKNVTKDPEQLLKDPSFHKEWEAREGLLDAADVFRFYAEIQLRSEKSLQKARESLDVSEGFYQSAKKRSEQHRGQYRNRVHKHYARGLILKSEVLAMLGDRDAALTTLRTVGPLLDESVGEELPSAEGDVAERYARSALEIESYLARLEYLEPDDELKALEAKVEQDLRTLIRQNPNGAKAYEMLYHLYARLKRDIQKALELLDGWANVSDQFANRLSYRAAQLCKRHASTDPSYALEALRRYASVLREQPKNTRAAEDVIELFDEFDEGQYEQAVRVLKQELPRIDEEDCTAVHALLRVLFCEEGRLQSGRVDSLVEAIIVIARGPDELLIQAKDWLKRASAEGAGGGFMPKYLRIVLELMSKWYFNRGRRNPAADELTIAERILDLSLELAAGQGLGQGLRQKDQRGQRDRAIWSTRKLAIARVQKKWEFYNGFAADLTKEFPLDPFVSFEKSLGMIAQGKLREAEEILTKTARLEAESEGTPGAHAAVLDRLAFVALRQGRFSDAGKLYGDILQRNHFDPTARFGLGRVYFEQGRDYWDKAFDEWLEAVRLRAMGDSGTNLILAWLTARSIASLCEQSTRVSEAGLDSNSNVILDRLKTVIHHDTPQVSSMLIDSLAAVGVIELRVADALYDASQSSNDIWINERIAQYFMARTVYASTVAVSSDILESELHRYVEWSQKKGVLPEYLAGAKGSYARALLRLGQGSQPPDPSELFDQQEMDEFKRGLTAEMRELYNHISTLGPSYNYYGKAYDLFKQASAEGAKEDTWVRFTKGLVKGVLYKMWKSGSKPNDLLRRISPAKALWPLGAVLHMNPSPVPGGWVDRDVLGVIEDTFGRNGWQLKNTLAERVISKLPEEPETKLYGKSGLFFRADKSDGQKSYVYIETLLDAELQTQDIELETLESRDTE